MLQLHGDTGEVLWCEIWASPEGFNEAIFDLAVDGEGNVFTVGRAFTTGYYDIIVQKYHGDSGYCFWSQTIGGAEVCDDIGLSIVVGSDGNPVVTGIIGLADGGADFVTAKLAGDDGTQLWLQQEPGAVNNIEARTSWLALMDNDDVVMASRTWSSTTGYDVVLHRYESADGHTAWSQRWNSSGNTADDPRQMVRDRDGNVLVCGVSGGDYFVLKVDGATGDPLWTGGYQGPPNWYDVAGVLAEAPDGTIVTSGFSDGTDTGWDVATVGFAPADGAPLWAVRYDGEGQSDEPAAIAITPGGEVVVTGYAYSYTSQNDLLTLCYQLPDSQTPVIDAGVPTVTGLTGAWPNPFNPRVTLGYTLADAGPAHLTIVDLRGRTIAVLQVAALAAGPHTATWDGRDTTGHPAPAGVYCAVLRTAAGTTVQKVVLAK